MAGRLRQVPKIISPVLFNSQFFRPVACVKTLNLKLYSTDTNETSASTIAVVNDNHNNLSQSNKNSNEVKYDILESALKHVNAAGWTEAAIAAGANDLGYPSTAHGLFPRGGADLALHFFKSSNDKLIAKLTSEIEQQKQTGESKSTKNFIRDALKDRIRMTTAYQSNWAQGMALMAQPTVAIDSLTILGQLIDDIWYLAGDQSHDMNWYTKRLSLAGVYKTSELYMLQDKSEDFKETWEFLERRLEDISNLGHAYHQTQDLLRVLSASGAGGLEVLRNMLGLNRR